MSVSLMIVGSIGIAACGNDSKAATTLASISPLIPASSSPITGVTPSGGGNLGTIPRLPLPSTSPSITTPTAGATTSPPVTGGPPCTFAAIHAANGPAPAGITDIDLRCEGDWASWVGKADDPTTSDGYFAVAQRTNSGWKTVNLGTAGVCADGGVPEALWTALNCTE
jgi:hypothetical protein